MTASSDWSVPRTDRSGEVHQTAPIAHQDKRFPRRAPAGGRRRRPREDRHTSGEGQSPGAETGADEVATQPADTNETVSDGKDHMIDTLA